MYNNAKEILEKNKDKCFFAGGVSNREIENTESELNVLFPESYKEFLRDFGVGRVCNEEILGITKTNQGWPSVLWNTKEDRKNINLRENIIPIYLRDDEFYYCLDTSNYNCNECTVVVIGIGMIGDIVENAYNSFGEFLLDLVKKHL